MKTELAFLVGAGGAGLVMAIAAIIVCAPKVVIVSNLVGGLAGAGLAAIASRELGIGYHSFGESLGQVAAVSGAGALAMLCIVGSIRAAMSGARSPKVKRLLSWRDARALRARVRTAAYRLRG